jgi:sn1-specific diacylglycerol lipase
MYMLDHPSTGWINLAAKALSCFTYPFSERHAKGDNTCGCYRTAFLLAAELEEEDLIFMSFRNGIVRRPYCIVVDQEKRAIVVVIRGTLSLEDTLTDLAVRPVSICTYKEKYGFVFDEAYCHAGMWGSAEWIFDDLKRHGGLENILKEGSQYSDFELCVVGHSLGGGVASVLSMMLLATYPSLKCYAFSPPGCVMSKEIAKAKHITSYVFESDIVPRLSLHSLENLRADILEMIASAKAEKHRIITRKTLFARTLDEKMFRERNRELLHSEDSVPASKFQEDLDAFLEYAAAKKAQRSDRFDVILYPPGRIVQILTTKREFVDTDASGVVPVGRPETHDLLTAVWASNEDFAEIQISDAFISDHRPSNVYQGLQMIAQSFSVAIQKTREDTSCKATSLAVGNFPDQQA